MDGMVKAKHDGRKIISNNKKARHDFFIEEVYEAGLVLTGTEIKSIRQGRVNLKDSYASIKDGEIYVHAMHVSPYEQGNIYNVDPLRDRKLLMHKREILKLLAMVQQKGYSLIPLNLYLVNGKAKMEIAVAKGKKLYDKRDTMAKKDAERRIQQHMSMKY